MVPARVRVMLLRLLCAVVVGMAGSAGAEPPSIESTAEGGLEFTVDQGVEVTVVIRGGTRVSLTALADDVVRLRAQVGATQTACRARCPHLRTPMRAPAHPRRIVHPSMLGA